jgi:hypothetical protein
MKTLILATMLIAAAGCSPKPHWVFDTPHGLKATADKKKIQDLLITYPNCPRETYTSRTDAGARRAWTRAHGADDGRNRNSAPVQATASPARTRNTTSAAIGAASLSDEAMFEQDKATRQRDGETAAAILAATSKELESWLWEAAQVDDTIRKLNEADKNSLDPETRFRLHATAGLLAYLANDDRVARREFSRAKSFGNEYDPKKVAPSAWTSGATYCFRSAK